MIGMKIEFKEDKTIVYLYKYELSFDNIEKLNKEIKNIFIKLIKVYNLDLHGFLKVYVYCNKIYGYVLEIETLYNDSDFEAVDLKLVIYENCEFYFKTSDYFLVNKFDKVYYDEDYFYVNVKELDNLMKFIEFGEIIYNFDKKSLSYCEIVIM